jgi:DNA polymerase III subunit delta'
MEQETNGSAGHRIKGFSEIIGQEAAVGFLKRALAGDKIPHAYLFTGIAGVGKTTAALAFTRTLNCTAPRDGEGCGTCVPCRRMEGGNLPDLEILRPDGRVIKIEQVRELARRIGLKTVSARNRVSIVERAETMTVEAANAFLKTLEEPPPGNILVLETLDKKDLLPTILSRCQTVPFRPVPADTLAAWLEREHGVPGETAAVLARLSEGSVGRALGMARSSELVDRMQSHMQVIVELRSRSPSELLGTAVQYAREERKRGAGDEDEGGLKGVLALWKTCFRDMMVLKCRGPEDLLVVEGEDGTLKTMSRSYTIDGLVESMMILDRAQRDLIRSRNPDLMMETALLSLKRVAERRTS